jgi:hypothetical protein
LGGAVAGADTPCLSLLFFALSSVGTIGYYTVDALTCLMNYFKINFHQRLEMK